MLPHSRKEQDMNKYSVEHNGKIYTRNTKRTYTHAIVIESENCDDACWSGRLDLAKKQANLLQKYHPEGKITIVEITA
jgi:hypothetical protein